MVVDDGAAVVVDGIVVDEVVVDCGVVVVVVVVEVDGIDVVGGAPETREVKSEWASGSPGLLFAPRAGTKTLIASPSTVNDT